MSSRDYAAEMTRLQTENAILRHQLERAERRSAVLAETLDHAIVQARRLEESNSHDPHLGGRAGD